MTVQTPSKSTPPTCLCKRPLWSSLELRYGRCEPCLRAGEMEQ